MILLKKMIKKLYPDSATRPKLLGPGGFYDEEWFETFLQTSGPNVVDGLTHHTYNLGAGTKEKFYSHSWTCYFSISVICV